MVLLSVVAEVVLEEQEPPYVIVPASVDEKVYSGVESLVGVATAVTSAIIGAVLAVSTSSSRLIQEVKRSIEEMMSRCFN